ncbi:MAG: hypothetical protein WKF41_12230 [Gaiellaceae bacterium]
MPGKRIAVLLLAASVVGACGSADATDAEDFPPPLSASEGKELALGTPQATVFTRFGESEGPNNATLKVGASRCYTYLAPGTEETGTEAFAGETVYDSWWICFDNRDRLVHKEPPDGMKTSVG